MLMILIITLVTVLLVLLLLTWCLFARKVDRIFEQYCRKLLPGGNGVAAAFPKKEKRHANR